MAGLDEIYGGILKPGPQGGIYEPGPEVQFPANSGAPKVVRVTPEGLNVYQRQVVAIDSAGNPILSSQQPVMRAAQQSGAQRTTGGMAGTVQLPAGVRPTAVDEAFAEIERQRAASRTSSQQPSVNDLGFYPAQPQPVPKIVAGTPRIPAGTGLAFNGGDIANPAVAAIDAAAPSAMYGGRFPMSRPLAIMRSPQLVPTGGSYSGGGQAIMRAANPSSSGIAPVMVAAPGFSFGGHDTSSPAAFAADVTRPSNMPGVETFTGTVQQGQGGQNRYGSTAHNELLRLFT